MLVSRYKLSLCHTPIKPELLNFPRIGVFVCGLRDYDHEVRITISLVCPKIMSMLLVNAA